MTDIDVRSPAFPERGTIPRRYAGDGGNVSPELRWSGVPDGTTELVLVCEDPDAPGRPFLHWLVSGIRPDTDGVPEGGPPAGAREWPNSAGTPGWTGPSPPPGAGPHRYVFQVYALDRPVDLPPRPTAADVHRVLAPAALATGATVARYER